MSLPEKVKEVIKEIEKTATDLKEKVESLETKAKGRINKAKVRGLQSKNAQGGGLGILSGLVTKFQKAHKPKNETTLEAAQQFSNALEAADLCTKATVVHTKQINELQEKYPDLSGTLKHMIESLKSAEKKIEITECDYQKAKSNEMLIFKEFMGYLDEKNIQKEKGSKEYKAWKKTIEENLKELLSEK